MKFTKILALFLAVMLCVCVFAGCNNNNTPVDDNKDNNQTSTGDTVSIKIVDNNANVIYEKTDLAVDLTIDAAEDGKLYIGQILALCQFWDEAFVYEPSEDEKTFVSINGLKEERVVEQVAKEVEPEPSEDAEPAEGEEEEEKEPVIVYEDVEFWYYWTMMINEQEVSIESEIELGDSIVLTFFKDNVADLIEG